MVGGRPSGALSSSQPNQESTQNAVRHTTPVSDPFTSKGRAGEGWTRVCRRTGRSPSKPRRRDEPRWVPAFRAGALASRKVPSPAALPPSLPPSLPSLSARTRRSLRTLLRRRQTFRRRSQGGGGRRRRVAVEAQGWPGAVGRGAVPVEGRLQRKTGVQRVRVQRGQGVLSTKEEPL